MSTDASVNLWGTRVGAVSLDDGDSHAAFQYDPAFVPTGIQLAPLVMPLRDEPYRFAGLSLESFWGLPGLLTDSLPDRYGTALIDAWLVRQGRTPQSFNAVERLCYIGKRGMGALEFAPARGPRDTTSKELDIAALVELAGEILSDREALSGSFQSAGRERAVHALLSVGTSAGGARAKALIAWNPATDDVRSGQVDAGPGFEYWILKFDGVSNDRDTDRALSDPQGYGAIEYAYSRMAQAAGIEMSECRLLEENGRRHFMTRRFDRDEHGTKIHMQSLAALGHYDYNQAGGYSYEQAFTVGRQLGLAAAATEEQVRRMIFNVVGRNQDDHVKNIAFLMDRSGTWRLAPAFDVAYAYRPGAPWTDVHQMTINGKRDDFSLDDLQRSARVVSVKPKRVKEIVDEVRAAAVRWPEFAADAGVPDRDLERVEDALRVDIR